MNITILLFGITTDLLKASSLSLSIEKNSSIKALKKLLLDEYPQLSKINTYTIAVNESYASDETILNENDVVAIIPPVSGG